MLGNTNLTRDYYKVLITGAPGKGKTYSFRNLPPTTTGFINVENKPLPFRNQFQFHARPGNVASVFKALEDFADNPQIEVIAIDSFSAFTELLLAQCRQSKKGFDIWNLYNEEIGRFFTLMKKIRKEVFITGHYEIINIEGDLEKRVAVKGKEWEGKIEKEFTIVLYSENKLMDTGKFKYQFKLAGESLSAKCPPDIFGEDVLVIDNDCKMVYSKILDFVR